MNNTYFIADLHCGPYNRRTVQQRGFGTDWQRHTDCVIENINQVVTKCDQIYLLGDLGHRDDYQALKNMILSLNTKQIFITIGNHDNKKLLLKLKEDNLVQDVKEHFNIKINNNYFHLAHYPKIEFPYFFENGIHLFGHVHNNLPELPYKMLDVTIDSIGYKPISAFEVIDRLKNKNNVDEYRNRILW